MFFGGILNRGEFRQFSLDNPLFSGSFLTVCNRKLKDFRLIINIKKSKTGQIREGEDVALLRFSDEKIPQFYFAYCPVESLDIWLKEAGISSGAVFRSMDRHGNVKPKAISKTPSMPSSKYIPA